MKIAIGADHAGYQLKDSLKKLLDEMGVAYEDFGTSSAQSVDYPDFAKAVAEGVAAGKFDRGILVCGTGVGMAIAANKVPGVRSAPIVDTDTAKLAREHNDLNVLTLGARVLPGVTRAGDRQDVSANAVRRRPPCHARGEDSRHRAEQYVEPLVERAHALWRQAGLHHRITQFLRRKQETLRHGRLAVALNELHGQERLVRIPAFKPLSADEPARRIDFVCRRHTSPSAFH